ncbi:MAG: hypothetical protein H6732_06095 [Alphaproteobacteria bacterium]|nr:hypothetical protein [Alphaproteobacteria bacterium]
MLPRALLPLLVAACAPGAVPEVAPSADGGLQGVDACDGPCGEGPFFLVDRLGIAEGAAEGEDLDGVDGDCDVTDAPGGVDNRFADLFASLPPVLQRAMPPLLQETVTTGGLNLLVEVVGGQGLDGDGTVGVVLHHATGAPAVDVTGAILPQQTFDVDARLGATAAGRVVDGWLTAGPFDVVLPLTFLNRHAELHLRRAVLRVRRDAGAGVEGHLAGLVPLEDAVELAAQVGGPSDTTIRAATAALVPVFVDARREEDGDCDAISATFLLGAVPAFVFAAE